ncbi:MAG: NUDIX domain-containing protein [Bacteroidales bacterium]|nr:NUDIX domain-containing protein [Bacteroidales bacterium]
MIKIYFKNRCICLSKKDKASKYSFNKNINEIDDLNIEINRFLFNDRIHHFNIYGKKSSILIKLFKERMPTIKAGGGIVVNNNNEYLVIYRNKIWDLPKGKQDHGETIKTTALREVSEECGISLDNLIIDHKLGCTYHMYENEPGFIIKQTVWYLMRFTGSETPIPQTSEGITKVKFVPAHKLKHQLRNSYPNIRRIIKKLKISE